MEWAAQLSVSVLGPLRESVFGLTVAAAGSFSRYLS